VARVVPSDIVKTADQMFQSYIQHPTSFPQVEAAALPSFAGFARLVEAVPEEYLELDSASYAALIASVAYLKALPNVFQASRVAIRLLLNGYDRNPIALIRDAMALCPDQAPTQETTALPFITDPELRESIRLDMSTAHRALAEGEYKAATVLAGSAVEALLLWKIQEREKQKPGVLAPIIAALKLNADPENWVLHQYIEVALQLKLIAPETVTQASQARDFRNLIHPGLAKRKAQKCDRGTAHAALSAVELVARDVAK